jgi:hypothetical protein
MKKKTHKKLQLHFETLRHFELHPVSGGTETRGFTNCAYCWSTPANCPTSIWSVDNNCGDLQQG